MASDGFHDVLLPLPISLGAKGGPSFRTDIVALASGHEVRRGRWQHARRRWDLRSAIQSPTDVEVLLAFFQERQGRRFSFRFRDPFDHGSTNINASPSYTDQHLGLGDGTITSFGLQKAYGDVFRPIRWAVTGSVTVAVDGIEVPTDQWALSDDRDAVAFLNPPAFGAVVSAGFLFDTACRFATDDLELQLGARGAATSPIELVEVQQ